MSKALTDNTISDEEYSLILLEFETFTRTKEDLRIKSKTSLERTGNIETEANVLFNRNSTTSPLITTSKPCSKPCSKTFSKTVSIIVFKTVFEIVFKIVFKTVFKPMFKIVFKIVFEQK